MAIPRKRAVAKNEALRLFMRDHGLIPGFDVTDEQRQSFEGTPYAGNPDAMKQKIAGRIYSDDPSAQATLPQRDWVDFLLQSAGHR